MIDRHSATWEVVATWAEREREACRTALDNPATDWDRTQVLRGRLGALRELLALAEPKPAITIKTETYGL